MRTLSLVLVLVLVGCEAMQTGAVQPKRVPPECPNDAVKLYRNSSGYFASCFILRHNNKIRLVTARHVAEPGEMKGWSENFDDVSVLKVVEPYQGGYLEPSYKEIPIGVLENEAGRKELPVTIIGFTAGEPVVTKGYICGRVVGKDENGKEVDFIFTTAPMYSGMSGSAVLDADGKVIGIAVAKAPLKEGNRGEAKSKVTPIQRAMYRMRTIKNL